MELANVQMTARTVRAGDRSANGGAAITTTAFECPSRDCGVGVLGAVFFAQTP